MANFTATADIVTPLEPEFSVIQTQSESSKKNFQLLGTTATERFHLLFKVRTSTERNNILSHYNGEYGGYASFSWTTVPSFVKSGTSQTVRYVPGSYKEEMISEVPLWRVEFIFEIAV